MAEDIDVAATGRATCCSTASRCATKMARSASEFVEEIARGHRAAEAAVPARKWSAELHEADLGDLIEALDSDDRVAWSN